MMILLKKFNAANEAAPVNVIAKIWHQANFLSALFACICQKVWQAGKQSLQVENRIRWYLLSQNFISGRLPRPLAGGLAMTFLNGHFAFVTVSLI